MCPSFVYCVSRTLLVFQYNNWSFQFQTSTQNWNFNSFSKFWKIVNFMVLNLFRKCLNWCPFLNWEVFVNKLTWNNANILMKIYLAGSGKNKTNPVWGKLIILNWGKLSKFWIFRLSLHYGGSTYPHCWLNLPRTAGNLSPFAFFLNLSCE